MAQARRRRAAAMMLACHRRCQLALLAVGMTPAIDACSKVYAPLDGASCLEFDLSSLPTGPFEVVDTSSYHTPYKVSPPCVNGPTTACTNSVTPCPAYAVVGAGTSGKGTCYSLGAPAGAGGALPLGAVTAPLSRHAGLRITVPNGEGGRKIIYDIVCNSSAPVSQGPAPTASHSDLTYPFTWSHPAGCPVHATSGCPRPPPPPLPTKTQLAYQNAEVVAIVCFQMDTYAANDGDPGCNPSNWAKGINTSSPATYNPYKLNVSQVCSRAYCVCVQIPRHFSTGTKTYSAMCLSCLQWRQTTVCF